MDLVVIGKYNTDNGGIYWILTAKEILSRFVFAFPIYRKDRSNMTTAVTLLLKQFKDQLSDYPKLARLMTARSFLIPGLKPF